MSKRRPATKSKHQSRPKIAGKAQRVAQPAVRSPRENGPRVALTESIPQRVSEREVHVDDPTTALHQEARLEPATALQDDRNYGSPKGLDVSSATGNVRAFQAKLLELAQVNMQFAFEFAQRLATIRSPVEFLSVTAEFTSKRSAMFLKHSKEVVELSVRW